MSSARSDVVPDTTPRPVPPQRGRKVLFASAHSIVDFSNGAAVATLDVLQGLASLGFDAQAFCTPKLDLPHEACFEQIIGDLGEPYQVRSSACGPYRARVLYTRRRDVPITVMRLDSTRHVRQRPAEVQAVLAFFRAFLDVFQPDVMLTYGGDPVTAGMIDLARRRGIPVVFAIHNLNYRNGPPLDQVDYRIVPSEFAQRHYREKIGLDCHVLPNPVDWERVRVQSHDPMAFTGSEVREAAPAEPATSTLLVSGSVLTEHSTDGSRAPHGWPAHTRSPLPQNPPVPPLRKGGRIEAERTISYPPFAREGRIEAERTISLSPPCEGGVQGGVFAEPQGMRKPTVKRFNGSVLTEHPTSVQQHPPSVREPRFVTFVNPVPEKGVGPFVRIAQELGRRRPEIPFLVVESRGTREMLAACGLGKDAPVNVRVMPNTTDPRKFYALTRIVLLPSLCPENQPLVAIEAMINGIPVIGSDRGGIPEVLGSSGFVLPLPARLTPASPVVPEAEEVEAWVETIIRLWDDRVLYEERSRRARQEAQRWHPDRLRPIYAEFFGTVRPRTRPSLELQMAGGDRSGSVETSSPGVAGAGLMNRTSTALSSSDFNLPPRQRRREEGHRADRREVTPLTFVVCISDRAMLRDNLFESPCLEQDSPHQVISALNAPSAAAGFNAALESARHEWVVLVHQDVVLPAGWDRRVIQQLREAERQFGPLGVAGVYGVGGVEQPAGGPLQVQRIGGVVDRGSTLREGPPLPARVATLDELVLILPRGTPLRADLKLGFHLYGADLCLQAHERGLAVVALDALCHHNSRTAGLNETFLPSARVFARKWAGRLPIATPCVMIDRTGQVFHLGSSAGEGSMARAVGRPLQQVRLE